MRAANRFAWADPRNRAFVGEPEPHLNGRRLDQPRGRCLGGSSSLNGMVFVRGHPQDYAAWVTAGAERWGWNDVLPYFQSLETWCPGGAPGRGAQGPITVTRYAGNHPIEDAFDANIRDGRRSGTALECIAPAMRRPNLTVLTGAQASRVLIEQDRAVGVAFRHRGRDVRARASREVVLAAGAFQSPQLLMLSGIGPVRSAAGGWVTLASADPFAAPRIFLNALADPLDLPRFRAAIGIARETAAQPAFDFCRGPEISPGPDVKSDADLDAFIRTNANSAYHPCGTCRIGRDPMAVVDPEARVRGIAGLRVAHMVLDRSLGPARSSGAEHSIGP